MKTAEEIILEIQELPVEERQKVADFLHAEDEEFLEENYSPEDTAKILQAGEEAERGMNIEEFSSMREARKSLGLT